MFQGRFKALLVAGMPICWKVCRYAELNPMRARMVRGRGVAVVELPRASGHRRSPSITHSPCVHRLYCIRKFVLNITLSADEKNIKRARKAAQAMGKSLNQSVRDYLEQLAAGEEGLDAELEALRSMAGRGNSGGQRISRDDLYSERLERQRGA